MRFSLILLHTLAATSVAARHIQARQDGTTSVAASAASTTDGNADPTTTGSASPASTNTPQSDPSAAAASSTQVVSQPATTSAAPTIFSPVPGSPATVTGSSQAVNQTTTGDPDPLPLPPKLTPAIGIAGALLIITGLVYGIIGIRHKFLYSFFGVMYLISLAVLVLIVYCMNPPVSDPVQGAYLVGIILSGCLCGGVGLIFRDLVDGVGCLLGGFCFSMWFLTLKDGGTITSSVGKAIFIGAFTVLVGATAVTKRTRRWGLIASIPFSGATATVLGIDCFSKAGLKEFWIYLWNINDDEFPVNTNTYPITRGMKVEIAGIIILFLLGLASQLKLFKVLKERGAKQEEKRLRKLESQKIGEPTAGKRGSIVEKEQTRWNSIYGGNTLSTLSGSASQDTLDKKGFSVKERHVSRGAVEMDDIKRMSRVTIRGGEDEIQESPYLHPQGKRMSSGEKSSKSRLSAASGLPSPDALRAQSSSPPPSVVPLPFKIPGIELNSARSWGSLSAIEEDHRATDKSAKRASGSSWKRASYRSSMADPGASRESLMAPEEGDGASSVAATLDDLDGDEMSISGMTIPHSPLDDHFSRSPSPAQSKRSSLAPSLGDGNVSPRPGMTFTDEVSGMLGTKAKATPVIPTKSEKRQSQPLNEDSVKDGPVDSKLSLAPAEAVQIDPASMKLPPSVAGDDRSEARDTIAPMSGAHSRRSSQNSDDFTTSVPAKPPRALTKGNLNMSLPASISRVASQYRTNEWAKHLASAAEPEDETMSLPPSPGVQVDTAFMTASKEHIGISPVVEPNQFTVPKPAPKRVSTDPNAQQSARATIRAQSQRETVARQSSTPQIVQRQNSERNVTSPGLNRQSSGSMAWPGPGQRGSRSVASPVFGHPIVEPPSSEEPRQAQRPSAQRRVTSTIAPIPENTLLTQRDSRIKAAPKSQSYATAPPNLALTPATPAPSVYSRTTPAQGRGTPTQDRSTPDPSGRISRQTTSRTQSYTPSPITTPSTATFDSHQPQRSSNADLALSQQKRENLLTDWRESLREDVDPRAAARKPVDEVQQLRLLEEKRQRHAKREQEKMEKAVLEGKVERKMRGGPGGLIDAHKIAMQKMQASMK